MLINHVIICSIPCSVFVCVLLCFGSIGYGIVKSLCPYHMMTQYLHVYTCFPFQMLLKPVCVPSAHLFVRVCVCVCMFAVA